MSKRKMVAQWAWFALFLGMMFGLGAGLAWAMDDGPSPAPELTLLPDVPVHTAAWPACDFEDSPGPCYWDAQNRGNGKGLSFTVDADGTRKYLIENN